jgi:hypothetical protein
LQSSDVGLRFIGYGREKAGEPDYIRAMKYLLCLSLLSATMAAHAQTKPENDGAYYSSKDAAAARKAAPASGQEAEQPFKGANTVVVHTSDSAATAFRNAGRALIASGYSPTQKDSELLYLLTGFRPLSQGATLRVSMRISVTSEPSGSAIAFTGTVASAMADLWVGGATPVTGRVEFRPSGNRRVWDELLRVADACHCGRVAYANRP